MSRVVLAYSGGLDTSVILDWLLKQGHEVHAAYIDVGQPCEDQQAILRKAETLGAATAVNLDAKEELCSDFAFPMLQWDAKYEGWYLLGTALARPLIAKKCLQRMREVNASAFVHGATGKGNDQCRFQLAAMALQPDVNVIAPGRNKEFRDTFPGRQEMIAYCEKHGIPVQASVQKPYSSDENCLHISYEAGDLENLYVNGAQKVKFGMVTSPLQAPDKIAQVTIGFRSGMPESIGGKKASAYTIVRRLNEIGGRYGIGIVDMVESRFVGMKSRGVYEAPGMTLLYHAHRVLEQITLDRDLLHLRDRLSPEVAEMAYYGFWYTPKMDALLAFIRQTQQNVTGDVTLSLYKGNIQVEHRSSSYSLYDAGIATMEGGGTYDQSDAEGFLRIQGLPLQVHGRAHPRSF